MKVMIELQRGNICTFTNNMKIINTNPMVILDMSKNGSKVRLRKACRIFTLKD